MENIQYDEIGIQEIKDAWEEGCREGIVKGREKAQEFLDKGLDHLIDEALYMGVCAAVIKSNLGMLTKLIVLSCFFKKTAASQRKFHDCYDTYKRSIDSKNPIGVTAMNKIGFQY